MTANLLIGKATVACVAAALVAGFGGSLTATRVAGEGFGPAGCANAEAANATRRRMRRRGFLIMIICAQGPHDEAPGELSQVYIQLMAVMALLQAALPPQLPGSWH